MKKGFTLIELLVVIAMIAILTGVVIASLGSSRAKARDGKRVSDIGQIQLALELYYEQNRSYPTSIYGGATPEFQGVYNAITPKDPLGTNYPYAISPSRINYHLGTTLEQVNPDGYNTDADLFIGSQRTWNLNGGAPGTGGFGGRGKCDSDTSLDQCYDVKGSNAEEGGAVSASI